MLPDWSWIIGLFFGATIGSFLNVVIYRLPRHISLSNPPNSFCPKCRHSLGPADLFPLLSWLISGGKCRYCKQPVASRYFWVELLNGSLWAGIWYQHLLVKWEPAIAIAYFIGVSILVAIIFIDAELYLIPDELNASLVFLGVGYAAYTHQWEAMWKGGLTGWAIIWGIALLGGVLLRQSAMGDGDIKMMRGVGTVLGPLLTGASVGLAVPLGLVGGITMLLVNRFRKASTQAQPSSAQTTDEEAGPDPFYLRDWLVTGIYYLLCLDILALFIPAIERSVVKLLANPATAEEEMTEDEWVPGPTAIPFGPYLAAGAVVCMLFGGLVKQGIDTYWRNATGANRTAVNGNPRVASQYNFASSNSRETARNGQEGESLVTVVRNIGGSNTVRLSGESRADYA